MRERERDRQRKSEKVGGQNGMNEQSTSERINNKYEEKAVLLRAKERERNRCRSNKE